MERESSSDEDEDHESLIQNNERKIPPQRSSFEISEEFKSSISRTLFRFNKRYLFAVFFPIFLIALYFSIDFAGLFRNIYSVKIDGSHSSDRMRESELRALYLLKNQQSSLFNLWNQTQPNSNSSISNLDNFRELRSELGRQIRINKQVQQILLSSHQVGNESEFLDDNADEPTLGFNLCRKLHENVTRKTIEWKPDSNKFLFAICTSGQMSNHLICLEKHMFFAALLGRVLVFPSSSLKFDYQYEHVLDFGYINDCFGRKVVMPFEEFSKSRKNRVHIDRLICYMVSPPCYVDDDHVRKMKSIGITMGKRENAWSEDKKKRNADDVKLKFACNDEVLAIGDMFYADVEADWLMQPGGPLAHKCKSVIQPSRLIVLSAQRFIQTYLGGNFIALHFRRHGFLQFCNVKKESCFFPIPQAADCLLRNVARSNAPVIYLSTDAADSETDLLQSLIVINGRAVPLVKRPAHNYAVKWDALLSRNDLDSDAQVLAMLDKTICAMSTVFIGASGSTFTEEIIRLRKDWGSRSICDEYLCQGEHPNFQADLS